jgi:3-hydroxyisobutyrate dehydrogenase
MGKNIFNCEKVGAGQIAKVCNNMALAVEMIAISESLALGKTLGMDSKILNNIMKVSSSRCWSVDT